MDRCAPDDKNVWEFGTDLSDRYGETAAGACMDAHFMLGQLPDVVSFDPVTNWCYIKWPDGTVVKGVVAKLCEPPPIDFDALGITSEQMTFVFSWGVAAVLGLWVLGYIIACGVQAINKA